MMNWWRKPWRLSEPPNEEDRANTHPRTTRKNQVQDIDHVPDAMTGKAAWVDQHDHVVWGDVVASDSEDSDTVIMASTDGVMFVDESSEEESPPQIREVESKMKRRASRPFKSTRIQLKRFMVNQYIIIEEDPFNYDLANVKIPSGIKCEAERAKVVLRLHLRMSEAQLAKTQSPETSAGMSSSSSSCQ